ncbi:PAS domain S-box protein [Brevibacillus daliensis]|uniref:PAS domain S-box protein n=1 Tax=Brevibacillus daliensis TaxID=2892995 RepID=UPI001E284E09|nr:PAS domain S-box protein [Brevibacillus daliensis]
MRNFSFSNDSSVFQSLVNQAPLGILSATVSGHIVSSNQAACNMFGYSEDEIIGKDIPLLFPAIHGSSFEALFHSSATPIEYGHAQIKNVEWIGLHRDGKSFPVQIQTISLLGCNPQLLYLYIENKQGKANDAYQSLFEQNPFVVFSTDLHGRINNVNPSAELVLGYTKEELIGRPYTSLLHLEEKDEAEAEKLRFRRILHGGHYRLETSFCPKDSRKIQLYLAVFPKIFDNQIMGAYFLGDDNTEQKQTEHALLLAQQDLKITLQEQEGMTFKFKKIKDEFIYTMASGELLYRLGLTPEYMIGRRSHDLLPYMSNKRQYYEKAWQGENVTYEANAMGVCYVASLRPITKHNEVVEVVGSCVDITERKKAEEELRATKDLLESLFTNTNDAIYVIDLKGTILRINKAFKSIYGWSEEEVIGRPLYEFFSNAFQQMIHVNHDRQIKDLITSYETIQERKDGSKIYVSISISHIHDAIGNIVGLATIARDITERKETEQLLLNSEKLSAIGQLAAGVAHEIRNPLAALRGFVQLLRSSINDYQPYFQIMLTELDRINLIVSELLVLSKPQALSLQPRNLEHLLDSVVMLLQTQAIIKNLQVTLSFPEHDIYINCEENQLKQVFINLLKNALEAMEDGGTICIEVKLLKEHVVIQVIDQGCGISEELIPQLGQPFVTTKNKGTGLGLMITYKIIKEHHGNMIIESQVGKGTTITIQLPVANGSSLIIE